MMIPNVVDKFQNLKIFENLLASAHACRMEKGRSMLPRIGPDGPMGPDSLPEARLKKPMQVVKLLPTNQVNK